ncbi:hypothetical protein [Nocardioides ganghwensis]|nr:hypothetical protein [Nocardioides ganghwensis]MBD3945325.1 hypothetical protein [Nocardioides ganghwensis]
MARSDGATPQGRAQPLIVVVRDSDGSIPFTAAATDEAGNTRRRTLPP